MSALALLSKAMLLIEAGQSAASLATRAMEAANNGDQAAADKYLEEARQRYADAREKWDTA
jgi:cellobiose-specific phosphotransferase system component IIA